MTYDTIIIGKGPAGISAAVYLVRAGHSVLVIGKGVGALEKAESIENYYAFSEPISGPELAARGIAQAERVGATVLSAEAVHLGMEEAFVVRTSDGDEYSGRTVLLATGKQRVSLKVPGFETYRGSGISFCATCDGFFYRGKRLAVVGAGDYAASEYAELARFTPKLTLFTNGAENISRAFPEGVAVVREKIVAFEGSAPVAPGAAARVERVVVQPVSGERRAYPVDGVFVAVGTAGAADFAAKIGVEVNGSDIVVDTAHMTNVPGIFAAGDCTGGFLQVAKAVSDGAIASRGINEFLKK